MDEETNARMHGEWVYGCTARSYLAVQKHASLVDEAFGCIVLALLHRQHRFHKRHVDVVLRLQLRIQCVSSLAAFGFSLPAVAAAVAVAAPAPAPAPVLLFSPYRNQLHEAVHDVPAVKRPGRASTHLRHLRDQVVIGQRTVQFRKPLRNHTYNLSSSSSPSSVQCTTTNKASKFAASPVCQPTSMRQKPCHCRRETPIRPHRREARAYGEGCATLPSSEV